MNPAGLVVVLIGALMILVGVRGTYRNVIAGLRPA